nr:MAG TPA: hypothetical protein [Caudoviricetes sp.]
MLIVNRFTILLKILIFEFPNLKTVKKSGGCG